MQHPKPDLEMPSPFHDSRVASTKSWAEGPCTENSPEDFERWQDQFLNFRRSGLKSIVSVCLRMPGPVLGGTLQVFCG